MDVVVADESGREDRMGIQQDRLPAAQAVHLGTAVLGVNVDKHDPARGRKQGRSFRQLMMREGHEVVDPQALVMEHERPAQDKHGDRARPTTHRLYYT